LRHQPARGAAMALLVLDVDNPPVVHVIKTL